MKSKGMKLDIEIKNEINKLELCKPIYDFAVKFLPLLSLSRRMLEYYSDLAKVYSVSRLKEIQIELAYFYIICYEKDSLRCMFFFYFNGLIFKFVHLSGPHKKDKNINK